jgi:Glycosyltransferase family 87
MPKIALFSSIRRANPRKKLWFAGCGLGIFLLVLVVGNQFIARDKSVTREMLGHDFLAFYTAGSFVRDGRIHDLYKLDPVKNFEQATSKAAGLEVGKSFGPWWNPPFYALVFEPLAALPYPRALDTWRWISLAAVLAAIGLLTTFVARASYDAEKRKLRLTKPAMVYPPSSIDEFRRTLHWPNYALVPLLIVISMPFVQSFSHGQNTFTSLLLLTITVALWRSENRWFAGMVGGLLFFKPQLGAVVATVMVFDLGFPALAGLCITGVGLLLVTMIALPGTLTEYLHLLPANVHWIQVENTYLWERHVTLKAFWRLLFQGREAGEALVITSILTYTSMALIGGALAWAAMFGPFAFSRGYYPRFYMENLNVHRDRLIAATIATMPLLMPFYFDYDLLLLAIPATLYAAERVRLPQITRPSDAWLTRAWVVLFFWMFFNPAIAFHSHVDVTVLLLSAVAGQLIWRAGRVDTIEAATLNIERPIRPTRLAA